MIGKHKTFRLTLALLEDSGWYYPDYSRGIKSVLVCPQTFHIFSSAQDLSWGRGAGCEFATQSCLALLERAREEGGTSPFCDTLMASGPGDLSADVVMSINDIMQESGPSARMTSRP